MELKDTHRLVEPKDIHRSRLDENLPVKAAAHTH